MAYPEGIDCNLQCLITIFVLLVLKKSKLERKGFYPAYTSVLLFVIEGSQARDSSRSGTWSLELLQRPWKGVAYCPAFLAHSDCFLIESRACSPGMASPTIDRALPQQLLIMKMEVFSQVRLPPCR